jgi:hypothetical protein
MDVKELGQLMHLPLFVIRVSLEKMNIFPTTPKKINVVEISVHIKFKPSIMQIKRMGIIYIYRVIKSRESRTRKIATNRSCLC